MRRQGLLASCLLGLLAAASTLPAVARSCAQSDLDAVVDKTGVALRVLNGETQPLIQARLRRLAVARGWGEAEAEARGLELVGTDATEKLDQEGAELLAELDRLASTDAASDACGRLDRLEATSARLIAVTRNKADVITRRLDGLVQEVAAAPLTPAQPPAAPAPTPQAPQREPSREASKAAPTPVPTPAPPRAQRAPPTWSWQTGTSVDATPPPAALPPPPIVRRPEDLVFTTEEIFGAGRGFFGSISAGLAGVIEFAFQTYGRPNGYILGNEGGGALIAGLRYGDGRLVTKHSAPVEVYWQGPSVGYDFGLAGSRVMFLVYNLDRNEDVFRRFGGIDGSAYLVGGVGITFLKGGPIVLAPIRTGLGLRFGASVGYHRFTPEPRFNPF